LCRLVGRCSSSPRIEGEALAALVVNKLRGGIKVAAAQAPGFGDRRKAMLEELAVLTDGWAISEEVGVKRENATVEMLGTAKRVVLTNEHTTVGGGAGAKADIDGRCNQIRWQSEETTSDFAHEKLQERLAKPAGGVAVIRSAHPPSPRWPCEARPAGLSVLRKGACRGER